MSDHADLKTMTKAYARWAPFYDAVYRRLLAAGRRAAVGAAVACGPEILEIGVGTGLSLDEYPAGTRVTGIDLSKPMLDKAQEKINALGLAHINGLAVMDACRLGFQDATFDVAVAQYVITLVPDPEGALDEFARVVKPGGEIVLVNHLGMNDGPIAAIEKAVAPLARRVGWSSEFKLGRIEAWATRAGFALAEVKRVAPVGFFTVIRLKDMRSAGRIAA